MPFIVAISSVRGVEEFIMKLAIISDIHDNLQALREALPGIESADAMICCGDLCSPFIIRELGGNFTNPIYLVFGNNEGDIFRITTAATQFHQIHLLAEFGDITLGTMHIAVIHYDAIARPLIKSGLYDLVCFGHNHRLEIGKEGKTHYVNPGELSGVLTQRSSYVLFDTETGESEIK